MNVWWVLSLILVTLMLVMLVLAWPEAAGLATPMTFVLQAGSVVFLGLFMVALVYFVVRRW